MIVLGLVLIFIVSAMDAEARSNGNRLSYIASKHKFHPDGVDKVSSRSPLVSISTSQKVKRRPTANNPALKTRKDISNKISSRSAIVLDSETGEVIYSLLPDKPAQPASTIKILTGLIAILSLEDEEWIPASRRAANMPSSKIHIKRGKSYRAGDMINAVLLSSANDASVALAEKIAGSERVFAKLMTHKAKAWGAENTVCKTASGLTAKGQKSTAKDLAVLFNRAMENDEFAKRIARKKVRTGYGKLLRNHNRALWQIDGSEGGKTGFTKAARQTYVGKFKRGDAELTVAVMGSVTMWDDLKNLVEFGFAQKKNEEMFTAAAK